MEKMDIYTEQIRKDTPENLQEAPKKWMTASEKAAQVLLDKINQKLASRNGMTLLILEKALHEVGQKGDFDAVMTIRSNKLIAEVGI